jgi:hypothetical protein
MHGMVSILPLSSNPPLVSRLEIVRERENAWKRMEWKRRCSLDRVPSSSTYEFVNGVFGYVSNHDEEEYIQSIDFFELPSGDSDSSSGEVTRAWTRNIGNLVVDNFAMDPVQDLLVLAAIVSEECVRLTFVFSVFR